MVFCNTAQAPLKQYVHSYKIPCFGIIVQTIVPQITEKDEIIANTEMIQKMLCDNSELEAKRDALQEEIAVTVELTQNAVAENSRVAQDQEGVITEFDDALWSSLVEKIVVKSKEDVTVVFKDGTEMKAE